MGEGEIGVGLIGMNDGTIRVWLGRAKLVYVCKSENLKWPKLPATKAAYECERASERLSQRAGKRVSESKLARYCCCYRWCRLFAATALVLMANFPCHRHIYI